MNKNFALPGHALKLLLFSLGLLFAGCGGGGGGSSTQTDAGGGLAPGVPAAVQPSIAATLSGSLNSVTGSNTVNSVSRAFAPILFAKQSVSLQDSRPRSALQGVTVILYALRRNPSDPSLELPPVQLAESQSNEDGSYALNVTLDTLATLNCGNRACATFNELMTLPTPPYRLRMQFRRSADQRADALDTSIDFRPVYNNTVLESATAGSIRVDAVVNLRDQKNTRIEVPTTSGTLVVESNIDVTGTNIAATTPLSVFRQTLGSGSDARTVVEVDRNGDGVFGESEDAVPGRVFLAAEDLDKPEFQSFLDKPLTTFIDANNSGKPSVVNFDTTSPVLQFASPASGSVVARSPITVRLEYGDDLGFQLSTLKISSSATLKITNPFEQITAGTAGAAALTGKFRKNRLEFGQVSAGALRSAATTSWMLGEASYTIVDPLTAFGPGAVTLTASIQNFASDGSINTVTRSVSFTVDGPPEFVDPFLAINTAEGALYNGENTQELTIRDVLPLTISYEIIPQADAARTDWLQLHIKGLMNPVVLSAGSNSVVTVTTAMLTDPLAKTLKLFFRGTVPQNFKSPPQLRISARDKDGNVSVRNIGLTVRTENVAPRWVAICAIPKVSTNPFSRNPQQVCTSPSLINTPGTAVCNTSGAGIFTFPEKEPATIVLCAYDEDQEDRLRFQLQAIQYQDNTIPTLPSTVSLLNSVPLLRPNQEITLQPFKTIASTAQSFTLTADTRGSMTWFDWTPPNTYGLTRTTLTFAMNDGIAASTLASAGLDVITIPDAPVLVSYSASGTVTNDGFYGNAGLTSLNGPDEFRVYLSDLNVAPDLGDLPFRINARQGVPYSVTLFATDDETPVPQVSLFSSGFLANTSGAAIPGAWLRRINSTGDDRLQKIVFSGTPGNVDALQSSVITVVTTDPNNESNPLFRSYRIPLTILDQNDPPSFSILPLDLTTNLPSANSSQIVTTTTLTVDFTEDQTKRFYVHAFDVDPSGSPFRDASRFVFTKVDDNLATRITQMVVTTSAQDPSRAVAMLEWTPESRDTAESSPTGVNQVKSNRMQLTVRALCPQDVFFGTTCIEPAATIDLNLNVLAVDDAPKFERLTVNGNVQGSGTTPIRLVQGQTVDIVQFVREEEAGQLLDKIEVVQPDPTLSFLLGGVTQSINDGNPQGSSIRLQGVPSNDSVDYVTRLIDGVPQLVPKVASLILRATPRGSSLVSTRELRFEVEDRPDAPFFSGLPNPAIFTVSEKQTLKLTLTAINSLDKDPAFKQGFFFRAVTTKLPNPVGNFSVTSSNTQSNTTGLLEWTPGQEHVDGVRDKSHTVGVEVCLINSILTCRQQELVITVLAVDDPPVILFGPEQRNLVSNPFTIQDPLIVQENSSLARPVRAFDPDGEVLRMTAEFKLVSPATVPGKYQTINAGVPMLGDGVHADILPSSNTPSGANQPPDANGVQAPLLVDVSWQNVDWHHISANATQLSTALYNLTLRALPVNGSAPTTAVIPVQLVSVNDAPRFTTSVVPGFVEQNSLAGTVIATLANLIQDEEGNSLIYRITQRFGNTPLFVNSLLSQNQVVLSTSPGESNVGTHVLQILVEEDGVAVPLSTVKDISFQVKDSNDAPFFVNSFLNSIQSIQEGTTSVISIGLIDRDLASSPGSERVTYIFELSENSAPFTTLSFSTSVISNQLVYTTSTPYFIAWTTLPLNSQTGQTGLSLTVVPQSLPDFSQRGLVLRLIAKDSFESQFRTDTTTVGFNILPVDNIPRFTAIQSQPVNPLTSFTQLCFDTPCTDLGRIVRQGTSRSFHLTSYNDESALVDPVFFRFASLFGSSVLTTTSAGISLLSTTNISINTDSATYQISPTNIHVGFNRQTLLIEDKLDPAVSVNTRQFSTHTVGWFVQDVADAPTLVEARCVSPGCVLTGAAFEFPEDVPASIELVLTDADLFSPKAFTFEEQQYLTSVVGLPAQTIAQLSQTLFAPEFFEFVLTNLVSFPQFRISATGSSTTTLFAFSTPSNLVVTSTTSVIRMEWASPSDIYTFPKFGPITWNFRARSFAANSVDPTRPTSLTTSIAVRVLPVNDQPRILNTQTEAQATEGLPFSFQISATDEEESSLTYLFDGPVPGNMSINPSGLIQWLPTNDDTANAFYNVTVKVNDSGKISSAATTTTTPLTSTPYTVKVVLTDVDAPAIHDSVYTPLTTATEDQLYSAQFRFTDEDKFDLPHYFLHSIRRNGQPISTNFNVQEKDTSVDGQGRGPIQITWTPALSGTHEIVIRVDSIKNEIVRSSVFYTYVVQVEEVNDPPIFAPTAPTELIENQDYLFNIQISDEDGDVPILSLNPAPGCAFPSFFTLDEVSRRISGRTNLSGFEELERGAGANPVSTYVICLRADDGQVITTYSYTLQVKPGNNAPTPVGMFSKAGANPVSNVLSQSQLMQSTEPLVAQPVNGRRLVLLEDLQNQITIQYLDEEGDGPHTFALTQGPAQVSLTPTQSTSKSSLLTLTWTPGSAHVTLDSLGQPVAGRTPVKFKVQGTDSRSGVYEFEFDAEVRDNPTKPCVRLINPACSTTPVTSVITRNINEDQAQSVSLDGVDFDPGSVISFSIVTSVATNPHPTQPVYLHSVHGNSALRLELDSQGLITFLPQISNPAILGSTSGVSNLVPVTFSVCGSPRQTSSHPADCSTATFQYRIQASNDAPVFSPSFPLSRYTTAAEGSNYIGLSFRQMLSQTHCQLTTIQAQEICVTDEESVTEVSISTDPSATFQLLINSPAPAPTGMTLSAGEPQCVSTTGVNNACLNGLTCSNCQNHFFSTLRTFKWDNISYLEPASRNITLQAFENSEKTANFLYTISIENRNRPPLVNFGNPLSPIQINEGTNLSFDLAAITQDLDSDPVTYRLSRGVSGMTINTNTGIMTWSPNKSHLGVHKIEFAVSDISTVNSQILSTTLATLQITVQRVNNPPRIDSQLRNVNNVAQVLNTNVTQGTFFQARILALDEEGDTFSFLSQFSFGSKLNNQALPDGFLDSTGRISWTPSNSQVGPNTLVVVARDDSSPNSPLSTQTFVINVLNINDPPVISPKDFFSTTVAEGVRFDRQYSVTDPDAGDSFTYSVSSSPSVSALLSLSGTPVLTVTNNGLVSFYPNNTMAGSYQITVTVRDGSQASDSHTFQVNVSETNNAPILEDVPDIYVPRDSVLYQSQLFATDPEGDAINYFFVNSPANVSLSQSSGLLTVNQKLSEPDQTFQVYAQDGFGNRSPNKNVVIRYRDSNIQVPQITSNPLLVAKVLRPYSYTPVISSVGQNLRIEPVEGNDYRLPQGMSVVNNSITWTPQLKDLGVHLVKVRAVATVSGQEVKSQQQRFFLTVTNQNSAPSISLATSVQGDPISLYDAIEGVPFSQTIAILTEADLEDSERFSVYFTGPLRSDEATSNPLSEANARLSVTPEPISTNPIRLAINLDWTPDNAAAFAAANGFNNSFTIVASDGIADSNVVTITFNVTNTNNAPIFYPDENSSESEIGYIGIPYERTFYARDADGQEAYFCIDTAPKAAANQDYPGLRLSVVGGVITTTPANRFVLKSGNEPMQNNAFFPTNTICIKGQADNSSPNLRRGQLSKAKIVWEPRDEDINPDIYTNLPLIPYDGFDPNTVSRDYKITIKAAPTISNLTPNRQFIGKEVIVSGGGIIQTNNPQTAKFLNSSGEIVATTSLFGITTTGTARLIVPKGAVSGSVSIGFSSFSTPYPFTVLNGETSQLAGYTSTDVLSAPSGLAVTFSADTRKEWVFVSEMDRNTVNLYELATGTGSIDGVNYATDTILRRLVIGGQTGSSGDVDGAMGFSRFYQPTGLSLAYLNSTTWLLVADTGNHKVKAIDLSDLYRLPGAQFNNFPAYTLINSTHLNRPYKVVQHPTQPSYFYVANTFNNTIEFFRLPNDRTIAQAAQIIPPVARPASETTTTVAGSGNARVDSLGNVFKPIDLAFNTAGELIVSSYTGSRYSYNSSARIFHKLMANRSDNTSTTGFLNDFSIGKLSRSTAYAGDVIFAARSTNPDRDSSLGYSMVTSRAQAGVNAGNFFQSSAELLNAQPLANTLASNAAFLASSQSLDFATSVGRFHYQSRELQFVDTVSSVHTIVNTYDNSTASVWATVRTSSINVTPANTNDTYLLTTFNQFALPADAIGQTLGRISFYDVNSDFIDDVLVPVPNIGKVYIFPGAVSPATLPATNGNVFFDTNSYWVISSSSFDSVCEIESCLRGVNHATFGRVYAGYDDLLGSATVTYTSTLALQSEDLILVNPQRAYVRRIESWAHSIDKDAISQYFTTVSTFSTSVNQLYLATALANTANTKYNTDLQTVVTNVGQDPNNNLTNGVDCGPGANQTVPTSNPAIPTVSWARVPVSTADPQGGGTANTAAEITMCTSFNDKRLKDAEAESLRISVEYYASLGATYANTTTIQAGAVTTSIPKFLVRVPPAPGGQLVTFTGPEYGIGTTTYEGTPPSEVCVGRFTNKQSDEQCSGSLVAGTQNLCAPGTGAGAGQISAINSLWTITSLTYTYVNTANSLVITSLPYSYTSTTNFLTRISNLEQMGLITSGGAITIQEPFSGTGATKVLFDTVSQTAASRVYCGQPYARSGHRSEPLALAWANQNYWYRLDPAYRKKDSLMFVNSSAEYFMIDAAVKYDTTPGKATYTMSNFSSVPTFIRAPKKPGQTTGDILKTADFVLHDFNADGIVDMAAVHPEVNKVSIRIGIGAPGAELFYSDDVNRVQVMDTLSEPVAIDIIRASNATGVDLMVTHKNSDSISIYKHQTKNRADNNMFQPGTHFNIGSKGGIVSVGANFTTNVYTGLANEVQTTGVAFYDNYYFGLKGSSEDYYHTGVKRIGTNATIPESAVVTIKTDPAQTGKSSIMVSPLIKDEVLRSTSGYFATSNPSVVSSADLNSDGLQDLISLDPINRAFSVTFSTSLTKGFNFDANSQVFATKGQGVAVAAADFNFATDNQARYHKDLAIANFDRDSVSIFYNGGFSNVPALNKDFTFNHTAYPTLEIPVGNGPVALAAGDLNQDGYPDLAVVNQIGNNLCILYNQKTQPGTFAPCIFYNTGFKPKSVVLIDAHASISSNQGLLDIIVLNSGDQTVSVFVNNGKGFNAPATYSVATYFPATYTLVDPYTEARLNPFQLDHFKMQAGDIGWKIQTGTTQPITENPRHSSLVIGSEAMIYTMKNIGDKGLLEHRSSLTRFAVSLPAGSLTALQVQTMDADSVIKAIAVTAGITFVSSSLSDSLYATNALSINRTAYLTGYLRHIASATDLSSASAILQTNTTDANPTYAQSALPLREDRLGAAYEALVPVVHPSKGSQLYAVHSGLNKGVLRLVPGSAPQYVVGQIKQVPAGASPDTQFGNQLSFNKPSAMITDPNKLSLVVADRGNGYLRVVDLNQNITRTMLIGNALVPQPIPDLLGVTNEFNTFNYYAMTPTTLFKVFTSSQPILAQTMTLDSGSSFADSGYFGFKIQNFQNLLYIGARDSEIQPQNGRIYRIDSSQSPFVRTTVVPRVPAQVGTQDDPIKGLAGFTINPAGTRLYYSEWQTYQIKMLDLTKSSQESNVTTLAGIAGIQGHFDGPSRYALLNRPQDLALNSAGTRLYFIDGASIRAIDLTNLGTSADLSIATVVGSAFDTGILDGFGTDVRMIKPHYLHYESEGGKDVLYVSDAEAHNIRKVVLQP